MYCKPGTYKCYGYDFTSYYAHIMASEDFIIPIKEGKEYTLSKLPKELKHGFYRVKITCENDDFRKLFSFSTNHTYLSISLEFAIKHKRQFDVKIRLIIDDEPNAYLYDDDCLVTGKSIFGQWAEYLLNIKTKFPKNKLIKHLSSSCWTTLNKEKTIYKTWDQMTDEKLDIGVDDDSDYIILDKKFYANGDKYRLMNTSNCYEISIRLKAWVSAYPRNKTAGVLEDIDNVVRIHTDGIVFKKKQKFDIPYLIPEDKTTGKIEFKNLTVYQKII